MGFTDTLLKIGRKYTENEILQLTLKEVSELKIKNGANEAYIGELEESIGKTERQAKHIQALEKRLEVLREADCTSSNLKHLQHILHQKSDALDKVKDKVLVLEAEIERLTWELVREKRGISCQI
jgi:hypothetical protein